MADTSKAIAYAAAVKAFIVAFQQALITTGLTPWELIALLPHPDLAARQLRAKKLI
jgi:hypothetical protein